MSPDLGVKAPIGNKSNNLASTALAGSTSPTLHQPNGVNQPVQASPAANVTTGSKNTVSYEAKFLKKIFSKLSHQQDVGGNNNQANASAASQQ